MLFLLGGNNSDETDEFSNPAIICCKKFVHSRCQNRWMEESTFCAHCTHTILVEDNAIWNPPEELTAPPQREVARQALNSFQESDRAFRIRVTPEFPFSVAPMDWFNLWEMIDAYLSFHSPDLPMIINDKSLTVNVEKDKISVVCTGLAPEGTGEVDQAEGVVGSAMSNDGPGSSGSQAATAGCGQIPIVPDEGHEQVANVDGVVGCDQMASGGAGNNNGSQTSGVKHGQVAGVGAGVSLGQMAGPYSASNGSGSQVVGNGRVQLTGGNAGAGRGKIGGRVFLI
ncbi:hypothetical protein ACROYT_G014989 [Oculina patagonica]